VLNVQKRRVEFENELHVLYVGRSSSYRHETNGSYNLTITCDGESADKRREVVTGTFRLPAVGGHAVCSLLHKTLTAAFEKRRAK